MRNKKRADASPVKILTVRLPPSAEGSSPNTISHATSSPNPGTGRRQYSAPASALLPALTLSLNPTSRLHLRHATKQRLIPSQEPNTPTPSAIPSPLPPSLKQS